MAIFGNGETSSEQYDSLMRRGLGAAHSPARGAAPHRRATPRVAPVPRPCGGPPHGRRRRAPASRKMSTTVDARATRGCEKRGAPESPPAAWTRHTIYRLIARPLDDAHRTLLAAARSKALAQRRWPLGAQARRHSGAETKQMATERHGGAPMPTASARTQPHAHASTGPHEQASKGTTSNTTVMVCRKCPWEHG